MPRRLGKLKATLATVGIASVVVAILSMLAVEDGAGQSFSPYAVFQNMSLTDLATLQVKLTYVGPQREAISTVAFTTPTNTLDLNAFQAIRRPGLSYANDNFPIKSFSAATTELGAMISGVAAFPNITTGGVDLTPYLSFAMLNTAVGPSAFEAVLGLPDAANLFATLKSVFANNKPGLKLINEMACSIGLLEPGTPANVTNSATVAISGFRLNRSTRRYVGTATVTNTSSAPFMGPVTLVFAFGGGVRLFSADGATCALIPQGRDYLTLDLTGGQLSAGEVIQVPLDLDNPNNDAIKVTTQLFAGPGAR
jgi:hypothetical protein